MPDIAYVNGAFMALEQAKVSVEDRGFQFGDGVYELIRSYKGTPFHLRDHIRRLMQSLDHVRLPQIFRIEEWEDLLLKALRKSEYPDAKIYLQVTRGVAPRQHPFPDHGRPTVVITVRKMDPLPQKYLEEGVSVITLPDVRWGRCDVKSINLLPNILAKQKAREEGALEALFIRNGQILEGAGSNIFSFKNEVLVTPPKGMGILSGVTREATILLARDIGIKILEAPLKVEDLLSADEALLTATSMEILPVVSVDGKAIGNGRPGPLHHKLYNGFTALVCSG